MTLWTCERNKKTYSICSSREITEESGHIQYQAGDHQKIDFEFPKKKRHPKGIFEYGMAASGDASITFRNGDYNYEINDPLRGVSFIFVWKEQSQKTVAEISCDNVNQSLQLNYTMKLMKSSGLWGNQP